MTTGKRLASYAFAYKKIILAALIMLTISVVTDLAGPFIAKNIIDQHILGIESVWFETTNGKNAVNYDGQFYKREKYLSSSDQKGKQIQILQVGSKFVFVAQKIEFDGKRTLKEGTLVIQNGVRQVKYHAKTLKGSEILTFYEPEIPAIIQLLAIYFGLLVVSAIFQYGERFLLQKSANRIIQKIREDVYAQIQRLSINYFDNLPAGKVVARITNDTEAIRELYVTVLATFFTSSIYITGIYVALFILNVKLA
ncbi:MAG: ABC transporter transmembrane domain-containing protein, partial [Bacillus sp. (in: firmicutes)]